MTSFSYHLKSFFPVSKTLQVSFYHPSLQRTLNLITTQHKQGVPFYTEGVLCEILYMYVYVYIQAIFYQVASYYEYVFLIFIKLQKNQNHSPSKPSCPQSFQKASYIPFQQCVHFLSDIVATIVQLTKQQVHWTHQIHTYIAKTSPQIASLYYTVFSIG